MHTDHYKPPEPRQFSNPFATPYLLALLIIQAWAAMIYPLTRKNFGPQFFRLREFSGFIVLWMYVGDNVHPNDCSIFVGFSILVFLCMIFHAGKANHTNLKWRQYPRYDGYPLICKFLPIKESAAKLFFEPLAVIGVGSCCISLVHRVVGWFLILGAIMCWLDTARVFDRDMRKVKQMHDAEMQMRHTQQLYERYKKGEW